MKRKFICTEYVHICSDGRVRVYNEDTDTLIIYSPACITGDKSITISGLLEVTEYDSYRVALLSEDFKYGKSDSELEEDIEQAIETILHVTDTFQKAVEYCDNNMSEENSYIIINNDYKIVYE